MNSSTIVQYGYDKGHRLPTEKESQEYDILEQRLTENGIVRERHSERAGLDPLYVLAFDPDGQYLLSTLGGDKLSEYFVEFFNEFNENSVKPGFPRKIKARNPNLAPYEDDSSHENPMVAPGVYWRVFGRVPVEHQHLDNSEFARDSLEKVAMKMYTIMLKNKELKQERSQREQYNVPNQDKHQHKYSLVA